MSRTLLLILLLIVSVAGLVALSFNTTTPSTTTIPVSIGKTTLSLSPPQTATNSAVSNVNVNIKTEDNKVTAVQLELSYDQTALGNMDVIPGTFFKNPVELFKKVDATNGRISYALGIPLGGKGISGQGTVAVLSFNNLKTSGKTTIQFLPKSLVSAEGVVKSVLRNSIGITFNLVPPNTPTPTLSTPIPTITPVASPKY